MATSLVTDNSGEVKGRGTRPSPLLVLSDSVYKFRGCAFTYSIGFAVIVLNGPKLREQLVATGTCIIPSSL